MKILKLAIGCFSKILKEGETIKEVIDSSHTIVVDTVDFWEVRWTSLQGEYSAYTKEERKVFLTEEDAKSFKKVLQEAYKLLKCEGKEGTKIYISKNDN